MLIENFNWRQGDIDHIARHSVEPYEVEEVVFDDDPTFEKSRNETYVSTGTTLAGRHLIVVMKSTPKSGWQIVTAREMTNKEKFRYRKWRDTQ